MKNPSGFCTFYFVRFIRSNNKWWVCLFSSLGRWRAPNSFAPSKRTEKNTEIFMWAQVEWEVTSACNYRGANRLGKSTCHIHSHWWMILMMSRDRLTWWVLAKFHLLARPKETSQIMWLQCYLDSWGKQLNLTTYTYACTYMYVYMRIWTLYLSRVIL